jgi:superfamily II DNA or RNA helicase
LSPELCNLLIRLAAFQNPEFYKAQAMRLPTYDKPRIIGCAENHSQHLSLPRGCLDDTHELLDDLNIAADIRDERYSGTPFSVEFQGQLRSDQLAAAKDMLAHDIGVLAATTAFGKTVIAAWLVAQRGVNTLILVHRRQLLEQWVQRLSMFLGVPATSIGKIGGGHNKPTGLLDVAIIQSLIHKGEVDDRVAEYGQLIVDECHHVSSRSFEQVVRQSKARYVTGLSATITRKDGHHPIIFMQCGPVRHTVDAKSQAAERPFEHIVIVRPTEFRPLETLSADMRTQFQELYCQLVADNARNELICEEVSQAVREGRCPLVLTERNDHLDWLAQRLQSDVQNLIILRGGMRKKELRLALGRLTSIPDSEPRLVLATGRYVGEGFDDARLDTLFLTLPVSWKGTIAQYAGRLHRIHHSKREVRIYDFADLNVPMLTRMFERRCRGYEAIGYRILVPGSAVAGWPAEDSLPVDPAWKSVYGASVRRLVRDGVDVPLAQLFANVAQPLPPESEHVARARSASEAYLYRRLESLSQTKGAFTLNAILPIPFDGSGQMEVDFCCARRRLIIELDGPEHFADLNRYRRDRRKDMLLQQHGYFVLRFLPEDLASELDTVLDTILRTFLSRESVGKPSNRTDNV